MMFLENDLLRRLDLAVGEDGQAKGNGKRPLRIAIYSHDAQGLGHIRRNLLISRALMMGAAQEGRQLSVLLISGLRETATYDLPDGVDSVTLPALGKGIDGRYYPRSLGIDTEELIELRSGLIRGAVASFKPDVLLVDKLPLGIFGELRPALAWLKGDGHARVVLGLRDILDEPAVVAREWERDGCIEAIRSFYDRIWVYGDQRVYDMAQEYDFPADVAAKMRYTGYLNQRDVMAHFSGRRAGVGGGCSLAEKMDLPAGSLTLCVVGGGRDGVPLASAFLRAGLPEGTGGVLVTGPLMEAEDRALIHALAAGRQDIRLIEFVTDPLPLLCCADRVIAMGGYNTVCEVLGFGKRTLIVPRVVPRREQIIRAERFEQLGLLDMMHPDELSAENLQAWIASPGKAPVQAEQVLDFHGAGKLSGLLDEVLEEPTITIKAVGDGVMPNGKAVHHDNG